MFLIKLHIQISILILITVIGFLKVYKEQIKKNGWFDDNQKKDIRAFLIFFVPILNLMTLLCIFMMMSKTKEEIENMIKENKKDE